VCAAHETGLEGAREAQDIQLAARALINSIAVLPPPTKQGIFERRFIRRCEPDMQNVMLVSFTFCRLVKSNLTHVAVEMLLTLVCDLSKQNICAITFVNLYFLTNTEWHCVYNV